MNQIANPWRHREHFSIAALFTYQSRRRLALSAAIVAGLILALCGDTAGQISITGIQPNSGPPGTRVNIQIDGLADAADGFRPTLPNKYDFCFDITDP